MYGLPAFPVGQVKTKMYLPESHFFKSSLAGASGQVLMSDPVNCQQKCESSKCMEKRVYEVYRGIGFVSMDVPA